MNYKFEFSSALSAEYTEDLEALLFFNPQQTSARASILRSVSEYGAPTICVQDNAVSVNVGALEGVQSLFVLADIDEGYELAGLVLWVRTDVHNVLVLHIAVTARFSAMGPDAGAMLVMRLVNAVRCAARGLRGVRSVTVMYSPDGPPMRMAVRQ